MFIPFFQMTDASIINAGSNFLTLINVADSVFSFQHEKCVLVAHRTFFGDFSIDDHVTKRKIGKLHSNHSRTKYTYCERNEKGEKICKMTVHLENTNKLRRMFVELENKDEKVYLTNKTDDVKYTHLTVHSVKNILFTNNETLIFQLVRDCPVGSDKACTYFADWNSPLNLLYAFVLSVISVDAKHEYSHTGVVEKLIEQYKERVNNNGVKRMEEMKNIELNNDSFKSVVQIHRDKDEQ
jgi:hypothetical protein